MASIILRRSVQRFLPATSLRPARFTSAATVGHHLPAEIPGKLPSILTANVQRRPIILNGQETSPVFLSCRTALAGIGKARRFIAIAGTNLDFQRQETDSNGAKVDGTRSFSKKSRRNGRKQTSKPRSKREKARVGSHPCLELDCGRSFPSTDALDDHYRLHHPEVKFAPGAKLCDCGASIVGQEKYDEHTNSDKCPGASGRLSDERLVQEMEERKKEEEEKRKRN